MIGMDTPVAEAVEPGFEDLLRVMVIGTNLERSLAYGEACRRGMGGMVVRDDCEIHRGALLTLDLLLGHLIRCDSDWKVRARGGRRIHSVETVQPSSTEDGGHGPAFKRGPA